MNEISQAPETAGGIYGRWAQLVIGLICVGMVANLQYGWTLFVNPIHMKMGWTIAAIQVSFTLFVLAETWLVPFEGLIVDKFGPRPVVLVGGILAALAWAIDSVATTLPMLYLGGIVSGLAAGSVFGACVGNALKWFPDKRGLAAGITAAGFGAGAALTVIPVANMIKSTGYQHTFLTFGLIQGVVIVVMSLFLIRPVIKPFTASRVSTVNLQSKRHYTPRQMLKTQVFWVMYALFVLVAAGGVIAIAQIAPIAKDYGLAKLPMNFLGATLPLLTVTLSIDNVCNGLTRPLTGWVSDRIGRENAMAVMFSLQGFAMLGLMSAGHNPYVFMVCAALIFLSYGEIFTMFPAICGDTFGSKFAAANNGTLYTAKSVASLLVPIASLLKTATGNWQVVFFVVCIFAFTATIATKMLLSPMRRIFLSNSNAEYTAQEGVRAAEA